MMSKIKQALVFLWGVAYASSLECLRLFKMREADDMWVILPVLFVTLSTVQVVWVVVCFFSDHWDEA